jgi:hypothetical protein
MKNRNSLLRVTLTCLALAMSVQEGSAQTWTAAGPVPREFHSAVLNTTTNRMIVFGGVPSPTNTSGQQNLNDVWRLNGSNLTWTAVRPKGTPPAPRLAHSAVYDQDSNRMIVFGGGLGRSSPCENDVWALTDADGNGGEWIRLNPTGSAPAPRMQHASAYDPITNTMIVYGGQNCFSTIFGDVWVLSHANGKGGTPAWTQLAPAGAGPGTREISGGVTYDPTSNTLIVFGGSLSEDGIGSLQNDVWLLSNANGTGGTPTWTQLSPTGILPAARAGNSTTYDPTTNSITISGGFTVVSGGQNQPLGDTWVLSNANGLGGTPAWTQITPSIYFPEARYFHTGVYNPTTNNLTVFGGDIVDTPTITLFTNDVWVLSKANGQ